MLWVCFFVLLGTGMVPHVWCEINFRNFTQLFAVLLTQLCFAGAIFCEIEQSSPLAINEIGLFTRWKELISYFVAH